MVTEATNGSAAPYANKKSDQIFQTGFLGNGQVVALSTTTAKTTVVPDGVTVALVHCTVAAWCKTSTTGTEDLSSTDHDHYQPAGISYAFGVIPGEYIHLEALTGTGSAYVSWLKANP